MANEDNERLEILRSALTSAKETVKACLLINSGAAVALLAFMGHLIAQKTYPELIPRLLPSLNWFVAGIVAATVGHAASYASNLRFTWGPPEKGRFYRVIAVLLTLCSIGSFIGGCYSAYVAFSRISTSATKTTPRIQEDK